MADQFEKPSFRHVTVLGPALTNFAVTKHFTVSRHDNGVTLTWFYWIQTV